MDDYNKGVLQECEFCNSQSPLFKLLTKREFDYLNKKRFKIRFKTGEIIRKQGTYLSHVISINTGVARLYLEGLSNRDVILKILRPGSFVGGPGIYVDHRHHYTVKALTETSACFYEVNTFKEMLHSNPKFADEFFQDFSRNTLVTFDRLINLTQKQIPGRMADGLIYLYEKIFESKKFQLILSKHDLGDLTGMSADSVVKILRSFREDGIIKLHRGVMEILDFNALVKISNKG